MMLFNENLIFGSAGKLTSPPTKRIIASRIPLEQDIGITHRLQFFVWIVRYSSKPGLYANLRNARGNAAGRLRASHGKNSRYYFAFASLTTQCIVMTTELCSMDSYVSQVGQKRLNRMISETIQRSQYNSLGCRSLVLHENERMNKAISGKKAWGLAVDGISHVRFFNQGGIHS